MNYRTRIVIDKDALIDNFLINTYALENYFQIDILDELDSIAKKIGATNEVKDIIGDESK